MAYPVTVDASAIVTRPADIPLVAQKRLIADGLYLAKWEWDLYPGAHTPSLAWARDTFAMALTWTA